MTDSSQTKQPKILKDGIFGILTSKMLLYDTTIEFLKKEIVTINNQLNQNDAHNKNVISYLIQRNEYLEKKVKIMEDINNSWI